MADPQRTRRRLDGPLRQAREDVAFQQSGCIARLGNDRCSLVEWFAGKAWPRPLRRVEDR